MRKTMLLLVLFTCVHFVFSFGTMAYSFASTMRQFDNPDLPALYGASAAHIISNALMFPFGVVWTSWASQNLPDLVEWVFFIANSALWGALGVGVLRFVRSRATIAR
jgi:hypothetical protein